MEQCWSSGGALEMEVEQLWSTGGVVVGSLNLDEPGARSSLTPNTHCTNYQQWQKERAGAGEVGKLGVKKKTNFTFNIN